MAAYLNKVFLIGNLTMDPEVRYTARGSAMARFSIAVNRPGRGPEGEEKREAHFFDVVAWEQTAEICGKYLSRGSAVLVEGRLEQNVWTAPDGQRRNRVRVVAENVQFLPRRAPRDEEHQAEPGPGSVVPTEEPIDGPGFGPAEADPF